MSHLQALVVVVRALAALVVQLLPARWQSGRRRVASRLHKAKLRYVRFRGSRVGLVPLVTAALPPATPSTEVPKLPRKPQAVVFIFLLLFGFLACNEATEKAQQCTFTDFRDIIPLDARNEAVVG